MIKKLSLLLGLIAALPASTFAWVGGPFDGGDFNQMLDDRGIYQAAMRFKNGAGFMQFGTNVDLAPTSSTSSTNASSSASAGASIGSNLNRMFAYYKGITYFGNATGFVDHDQREVQGFANGSSDVSISTSSSSGGGDGGGVTASATTTIVSNFRYAVFNCQWKAKITSTHPEVRFAGKGEITVFLPFKIERSGNDELIYVPNDGLEADGETIKLTVYGARKFFLSQR